MTKTELKSLYSQFRKAHYDFRIRLETSNWPCGYDDMKCEQFADECNAWLDKNPIIKQVVANADSSDNLEYRQDARWQGKMLKGAIKYSLEAA